MGYLGAGNAPLRGFGGIWFFWGFLGLFGRTRCAPTGFWWNLGFLGFLGGWAHAMRPYGFLVEFGFFGVFGGLGARDAPLRVFGVFWGYLGARNAPLRVLDAAEGEKPPHQVNLDTFREKIFLYRESLK
ncbi:hypothetical protein D3800_02630 [Microcystis aeruginosa NIES-298]|uniref:hypothetical protein n=1 Tax=Microcystis aeruginosa TaxID=1126 RepID=UPI001056F33D|nr:hypothetical protein [Microcystis aeruginosa]QHU82336.1 hypothetical protein D3800_02630 [Microcystis aeruginosa NIES-298]